MKKNHLLLTILLPIFLSSCSGIIDVNDLTTIDCSNVNLEEPNFSIILQKRYYEKLIYASHIQQEWKKEIKYEMGNDKYLIVIKTFTADNVDYIVADKQLSKELDYVFDNAIFGKCCLDIKTLKDYIMPCVLSLEDRSYVFDVKGHLLYYVGDEYYRSDLQVSIEDVYMHRFYIEEEYCSKHILLNHDDKFVYRNNPYSFDDFKFFLGNNSKVSQWPVDINADPTYITATDLDFTFFDDLPIGDDYICINDNIKVSKDHKIYVKYDSYVNEGHYLNDTRYEVNAPIVLTGDIGETFDDVFKMLDGESGLDIISNHNRIYANICSKEKHDDAWTITTIMYYGTYSDYDVVYFRRKDFYESDVAVEYTINGLSFFFPTTIEIVVMKGQDKVGTLLQTYNQGFITDEDISFIHKYHTDYFKTYREVDGFFDFPEMG